MGAHDQTLLSAQTDGAELCERFVVTKVSNSGNRFFCTAGVSLVETQGGNQALVAETSLFLGDAYRFHNEVVAQRLRDDLNENGIGGAAWMAVPYTSLAGEGAQER
ncbi:hypothetical protein FIV06_09190 [Labrenzia sp. THAF191b]|uniref:hypothetical protein n=1 Tax=unclassified Labrenzia TaxID=2648686 RepID=UPI0012697809|nr:MULTISPECIES: hypothetical protein [unclassified Labrenzia]QFS97595.1 hypothetical protein FIV06_09190 [Labrenzia sp. THAF191b]QFT03910.1 hypothetical protein FIV05_09190 [Labrenzia sp. THAF191a]QFT15452.1 hypothetical protein FIV03_09195 [Labrenzia sp. THAF187b]